LLRDQFKGMYAKYVEEVAASGDTERMATVQDIEVFVREGLTRKALSIICRKKQATDLQLVRATLRTKFVNDAAEEEIDYLRKFGEWEDIPLIIERVTAGHGLFSMLSGKRGVSEDIAARAIGSLGRSRFAALLLLEMPANLLCLIIANATDSNVRTLRDSEIEALLAHSNDAVRKVTALKCIRVLSKSRMSSLFASYLQRVEKKFYNVIHWLDFGISTPRDLALPAAGRLLKHYWALS
jgi:hypothetical protein